MQRNKRNNKGSCAKTKGKDQFSKRQRRVESDDMKPDRDYERGTQSKVNDWRWYARSPELVAAYASFPFGVATGNKLQYNNPNWDINTIPGVMALYYAQAIGDATSEVSPVNVAMRQLYSDIRHKNSGSTNYDATDLMMYILAMDSPYMYIAYLRRLYGVLMNYSVLNRYTPKAIVESMGVNYDDIKKHITDLYGYVNLLSAKVAGSLCIPNGMSYMVRHSWMTSKLFVDSMTSKAQMYLYVPSSYQKLQPITEANPATMLSEEIFWLPGSPLKEFNDLVSFGNDLIEPLLKNEDINIMSGDILKAYGMGGIVSVPATPQDYQVLPEYSTEVLSQIENTTVVPLDIVTIRQNVDIGKGYLYTTYTSTTMLDAANATAMGDVGQVQFAYSANKLLNFHMESPTPADVLVATRNMVGFGPGSVSVTLNTDRKKVIMSIGLEAVGSEIVRACSMYHYNPLATGSSALVSTPVWYLNYYNRNTAGTPVGDFFNQLVQYSRFDWAPAMIPYECNVAAGKFVYGFSSGSVQDVDMYTFLTNQNLYNLHQCALMQELWAPVANSTTT